MALSLGVAALFFGIAFIIVGFTGGDTGTMTANLGGMMKGDYLPASGGSTTTSHTSKPKTTGATSTTGGANNSGGK